MFLKGQPIPHNRMVPNVTGSATWNLEAQKPWFGDHQGQRSHTPLIFVSHKVKESCSCNVLKGQPPSKSIKHNWDIGQKRSPCWAKRTIIFSEYEYTIHDMVTHAYTCMISGSNPDKTTSWFFSTKWPNTSPFEGFWNPSNLVFTSK